MTGSFVLLHSSATLWIVNENSPPLNENLPSTSALGKISNSAEAVFGIHIFHFNPPLEISKEFERKYLKIRQIAFTNPLNLILRLIMIMIIIKEHFWLPCHCYGCSSNEWWTVIIMRSQFWYLRWVSGECMAEIWRQEFGPNSLTNHRPVGPQVNMGGT